MIPAPGSELSSMLSPANGAIGSIGAAGSTKCSILSEQRNLFLFCSVQWLPDFLA